jgi:rhomboid protease GluP
LSKRLRQHPTMPSLHEMLRQRIRHVPITQWLLTLNILVFVCMLLSGAGFWHSPNIVQLNWGANFAPATQNGEWWRLGSAMFLHFGVMHLAMNMLALWDCGRLVERMYGHLWFLVIYLVSGLMGNLFSLVMHGNQAISGGASGAIFGIYGALIIFLWMQRRQLDPKEFKLFFGAAVGFSAITILLGFVISGIDNYAHIGGFIAGLLLSAAISGVMHTPKPKLTWLSLAIVLSALGVLILNLPKPKYNWHDEQMAQQQIQAFIQKEQMINRAWLQVIQDGKTEKVTFDELANRLDKDVGDQYQQSFEMLSKIPINPAMPSAHTLESLLQYTQQKRDTSKAVAEQLRARAQAGPRVSILPILDAPESPQEKGN